MSGLIQIAQIHTQCTWYIILKARNLYGSGFLNGGGGGIRTNIFAFCSFKFYPVTPSIV